MPQCGTDGPDSAGPGYLTVNGQESTVNGQESTVSGQWSEVSGQRRAYFKEFSLRGQTK